VRLRIGFSKKYASYVSSKAIQHRPPVGWTQDESKVVISGLIKQVWRPKPSGNFIVLQMEKIGDRER